MQITTTRRDLLKALPAAGALGESGFLFALENSSRESRKSPSDSLVSGLALPPYGLTNADNVQFLSRRPVPEGFRVNPSANRTSGADEWEPWLAALATEMSGFLWPIYDGGVWVGAASVSALSLTQTDLRLIDALRHKMDERIVGKVSQTAKHREAFQKEDEGPPGPTFAMYQSGFPSLLDAEMLKAVMTGGLDIARPASQGLKRVFQRPRPQLTAMLLGVGNLTIQASKSAITPSMVSGHYIQGTLALAQVHASMGDLPSNLLDSIGRFLIDTGDRRVFAGLHYPSDNVGSWFVALRMCKHLFGPKAGAVQLALWQCIQQHSAVYAAIAAEVAPATGGSAIVSPYASLLKELREAAAS